MAWLALRRLGPVLAPRCPRLSLRPQVPAVRRLGTGSLLLSGECGSAGGGPAAVGRCRLSSRSAPRGSVRSGGSAAGPRRGKSCGLLAAAPGVQLRLTAALCGTA